MKFTTTILRSGKNASGITVPDAVMEALDTRKRFPVVVRVNGFEFRSTVTPWHGAYRIPLSLERREAAGITIGDEVEVDLEVDTEPRFAELPTDLDAALVAAGVRPVFDTLTYSHQLEHIRSVNDAKTESTRLRRITAVVAALRLTTPR
jgi:antitoxin component of MazEF toxin-antitoxin module